MPMAIIGWRSGSMAQEVGKPAVKPSTERPTICSPSGLHAGHVEHLAQVDTGPEGVADEVVTDLVGDTGDGHVLLEERHREQVVVGQGHLAIDIAEDAQGPVVDVHARVHQRGVDAVEVLVGSDDGRDARDVEGGPSGYGRQGRVGHGQLGHVQWCPLALDDERLRPTAPSRMAPTATPPPDLEEVAAVPVGHARGRGGCRGRCFSAVGVRHVPGRCSQASAAGRPARCRWRERWSRPPARGR